MTVTVVRVGELVLTGGAAGDPAAQVAAIGRALATEAAGLGDLCLLRAFYQAEAFDPVALRAALAAALPEGAKVALTLVPVEWAGLGDAGLGDAGLGDDGTKGGRLSVEAVAVEAVAAVAVEAVAVVGRLHAVVGEGPFVAGLRRGRFVFLAGQAGAAVGSLAEESRSAMLALGRTLAGLGAGFGDVVRMNRWYHAGGTKEAWEPSALAVAGFYAEPGPIATAIPLPVALPDGRSIQIELMGMIGEDGAVLPKTHSWPVGLWDWPVHLPYKHGLACGGLGFVGGQVSLNRAAEVIDPEHLDRQVRRSLAFVDLVAAGLGQVKRLLHLGVYYEIPPGGLAGGAPGAKEIAALGRGAVPAVLAGFANLSYPQMRVEIEAMVELADQAVGKGGAGGALSVGRG